MNKYNKGFTIVELIVVIAIIAVLAGIVLVNVTSYIAKGKDAAIKGDLSATLTNAAAYFDLNPSGATVCADTAFNAAFDAADAIGGTGSCADKAPTTDGTSNWCACMQLVSDTQKVYCVDSTGKKLESTTTCATECADNVDYTCDGA